MTNSYDPKTLERIAAELVEDLRPSRLRTRYEEPVDLALARFLEGYADASKAIPALTEVLESFIRSLGGTDVLLVDQQHQYSAAAHAVFLLAHTYRGREGEGYEGAVADVRRWGNDGLAMVLGAVAEEIKRSVREGQMRRAFLRHLQPLSRKERRYLALHLQKLWGLSPAEDPLDSSACWRTPSLEALIWEQVRSDEEIMQVWGPS